MLRLSELSGFLVGCNRFEKICGKISAKNCKIKPLTIETMGGVIWGSGLEGVGYILHFAIRDYQINLSHCSRPNTIRFVKNKNSFVD